MPFQAFYLFSTTNFINSIIQRANNTVQELECNVRSYYYNIKITFIFACFTVLKISIKYISKQQQLMKTFSTEPALSYIETILSLFIESSKMGLQML